MVLEVNELKSFLKVAFYILILIIALYNIIFGLIGIQQQDIPLPYGCMGCPDSFYEWQNIKDIKLSNLFIGLLFLFLLRLEIKLNNRNH